MRKYILYMLLSLIIPWSVSAQVTEDRLLVKYLHQYEVKKDSSISRRIAERYMQIENWKDAESWISKAFSDNMLNLSLLKDLAIAKTHNGKFAEAKKCWLQLQVRLPLPDASINVNMTNCDSLERLSSRILPLKVENISLNSSSSEYAPFCYKNGILFTSDKYSSNENGSTFNIYFSPDDSSEVVKLFPIEGLPSEARHVGPAIISNDDKTIYFTISRPVKAKKYVTPDPTYWDQDQEGEFINRLELYSATNDNGKWTHVKPFIYNNSLEYSVGFATLSADGKTIYFASDMPGGFGGSDLYYCQLDQSGKWQKPVNLGNTINTPGKESFPVIDKSGTLYFSSTGHLGLGGFDIFSAKGKLGNWKQLKNVGLPINSNMDDIGLVFNHKTNVGYFSSNRDGGKGSDDIYSFTIKNVKPRQSRTIPLVNNLALNEGQEEHFIFYFDFDKSILTSRSVAEAERLIEALKKSPNSKLELTGHTDSRGSNKYNINLSFNRVKAVRNYLMGAGIDETTLTIRYLGETELTNECKDGVYCKEEKHLMNRRVEVRIIKKAGSVAAK